MKPLYAVLLIMGVALGPAYWTYGNLFSGTSVARLGMQAAADNAASSEEFAITEDMLPVALILTAHGSFLPTQHVWEPPKDRYKASLFLAGERVLSFKFVWAVEAVANSEPSFKQRLFLLNAYPDGGRVGEKELRVVVEPEEIPQIDLQGIELDVRSKVKEANRLIVMAGVLLLIAGILGLVFASRKDHRAAQS